MDIGVLGPLCEGAGERKRDWGREFKSFILSLRRFVPPPSQREALVRNDRNAFLDKLKRFALTHDENW